MKGDGTAIGKGTARETAADRPEGKVTRCEEQKERDPPHLLAFRASIVMYSRLLSLLTASVHKASRAGPTASQ